MSRAIFEHMDRLEIEVIEGSLVLQQFDTIGNDTQRVFIPLRYVEDVIAEIERVSRGGE